MNRSDEPLVIREFATRTEADVARSVLAANGIRSVILADDAGGAYPFPSQSGFAPVRLAVRGSDSRKAIEILKSNNG